MLNTNTKDIYANKFANWIEELKKSGEYYSETVRIEVAESIYELMEKHGIKKAELARRLNTSRGYVTKLLQGDKNLTLDSICKVAYVLGCKLNNLEFVPLEETKKLENYKVTELNTMQGLWTYAPNSTAIEKYKNKSVATSKELNLKGKNNERFSNAA